MTIGFAVNPIDGVRTAYDDSGGGGDPVLVYPGFSDPLEYAKSSPLCRALSDEFRLIYADHRGQGRSDKPHDVTSYTLSTRVNDAASILDTLGIERSHYLGFSSGRGSASPWVSSPERVCSRSSSVATSPMSGPRRGRCSRP